MSLNVPGICPELGGGGHFLSELGQKWRTLKENDLAPSKDAKSRMQKWSVLPSLQKMT